jgi:hypothetical protein
MITARIQDIPIIDGLILIDCAKVAADSHQIVRLYYQQLIKLLSRFHFNCLVNSNIGIEIDYSDHSQLNTFNQYCWNNTIGQTSIDPRQTEIIYNMIRFSRPGSYTSNLIHNRLLDNERSIFLTTLEDFLYHVKTRLNDATKNWLVVGQSWNLCVHSNNLGLKNIAKLSQNCDLNFYAIDQGFCMKTNPVPAVGSEYIIPTAGRQEFENNSLQWAEIPDFGYKLILQK